ncbi:hypothetical protein PFNF54_00825 [Plasmodium falciparum NF54]|uniref:Erythrocyte membrane protein 1 n=1 Tax=Plasmodium falciparum (isolate NF54) TaxID=5843 RepID=W7K0C0_PLAFO|nr:hypothetical protein PFNF54_00825 [Plasmodium falciparum NF54]
MFYTLGDYRDILFSSSNTSDTTGKETPSSSNDNLKNIVIEAGGTDEKDKQKMKEIQQKIDKILKQSGTTPPTPVTHSPSSGTTPSSWWENNAKHIWKGMVCALTYKDNTNGGPPTQDNDLKKALWDDKTNEPKKSEYKYDQVELKEENSGTGVTKGHAEAPGDNTPLSKFVLRPPYFRYLEEWGETFCRERTRRLGKIKGECKVDDSGSGRGGVIKRQYSGDGEDCDKVHEDPTTLPDLGSSCPKSCSSYRKWIKIKKDEYEKQQKAYEQQKKNCEKESEGVENKSDICDQKFLQNLKNYGSIDSFLDRLKKGPCSKTYNESGEDNNKIFEDTEKTFGHQNYCGPCSEFKINCEKGNCDKTKGQECNGKKTIDAQNFEQMGQTAKEFVMRVSDNDTTKFEGHGLEDCNGAGIFKGIKENKWKCDKVCGYVVCKPKNGNGKNEGTYIIQIRALVRRWVEYFLEDYNKIRKKLKPCINDGKEPKCIKTCDKKCNCAGKWIKLKQDEWENIKNRFNEQYKNGNEGDYPVKTILEELISRIAAATDKAERGSLDKLKTSLGCNCSDNSQKKNTDERDIVECLLEKLQVKATSCQSQHSDKTEQQCQEYTPEPDEEDLLLEEENENQVENQKVGNKAPAFCPPPEKPPKEEPDEKCGDKEEEKEQEEEKDKGNEEQSGAPSSPSPSEGTKELPPPPEPPEEAKPPEPVKPTPAPAPAAPPAAPAQPTLPADEPFNRDILATTIPFGIAFALGSIAFLFLKKKTKSTIDLLRVINIPKSDYDIPTKLSPNRYIPYTSGKYRGKRYIYLEGDSGTDSGYTDHYSDITSSSESEYEEMDINDIYVPGSPKYKTLIEVVLEPSGNNTTASGNNTTASGNNTTASGNNTTASDTQNDIQNDGIPSNKFSDNEWNTLKDDFISQYLQSEQPNDLPNDYKSGNVTLNTEPNILYFDKPEEKPFITSIHDRNLYTGEEYSYNINMSTNSMDDIPINRDNNVYSGIDLINDALNGDYDIYDEMLKRKENELFGTNHVKQTSIHSVAKNTNSDPIHNQLELFHKWLDRHRDMCEQWENHHERLAKLKEEWENDTSTSGNTHPSDSNKTLNTDVSIQIDMDDGKPKKEFTNMDTILEDLDKYNEPYYDVQDDIYYDCYKLYYIIYMYTYIT